MAYYYYRYSALGPVWAETRAQSGDWYGSGTLHPGQVLRGSLPLLSPAFRRSHFRHQVSPSGVRWNCGRECCPVILPKCRLPRHLGIFYMPQIYDMGPTALLPLQRKACWGFFFPPLKIRRLRPGLNPRTWVLKASTLPLDHRSRCISYIGEQLQLCVLNIRCILLVSQDWHHIRSMTTIVRDVTVGYKWNSRANLIRKTTTVPQIKNAWK